MKPLLIGEAPSKNEPLPKPLEGRIGRRLATCAGLTFEQYLAHFDRVNLLEVRQDTAEHGFKFDRAAGQTAALKLYAQFKPDQVTVLLGKRVADCFGAVAKPFFEPYHLYQAGTLYVIPHPSGVNRWYNDTANHERMHVFMRQLVSGTLRHEE